MSTENPIAHACRLLRETAKELQQAHTRGDRDDWTGEPEAKAAYDEHHAAADALEALAASMVLSDERIRALWFASKPTPDGRPASWNFARSVEAEVREQYEALIRQLVEALGNSSPNTDITHAWQDEAWMRQRSAAITAARARLEGKP